MARRTPLAVARAQPHWPALRLPLAAPRFRRVMVWAAAAVAVVALGYVAARETSLFAVRTIEVTGASPALVRQVEGVLHDVKGESLVRLDRGGVAQRLAALPAVIGAHVDRAFPNTLRIAVEPEQPLAVLRAGTSAWVVSRRGTVIGPSSDQIGPRLPRLWIKEAATLSAGGTVSDARARDVLAVLARIPADFPVPVKRGRADESGITLVLRGETELRFGQAEDISAKVSAADAVLGSLSRSERAGLEYLDVSLPERPVGKDNPQVVG